jgi:phosphoglycolate phosphatase
MTILFDLDGTLIDSTEAILESFAVTYDAFDQDVPSDAAIKALIGHPLEDMFMQLGVKETFVDHYVMQYKDHYRTISVEKTYPLGKAKEAVELASSFAKLGVVTTKTGLYSKEILEGMGILDYFNVVIGREDVINAKPDPEPMLLAMEQLNADPATTFMIGDTHLDLLGAKNAKIKGIGVLSGYDDVTTLQTHTDMIEPTALDAVQRIKNDTL